MSTVVILMNRLFKEDQTYPSRILTRAGVPIRTVVFTPSNARLLFIALSDVLAGV